MADSHCYMAETNTTLLSNYPLDKIIFLIFKKRINREISTISSSREKNRIWAQCV